MAAIDSLRVVSYMLSVHPNIYLMPSYKVILYNHLITDVSLLFSHPKVYGKDCQAAYFICSWRQKLWDLQMFGVHRKILGNCNSQGQTAVNVLTEGKR